MPMTIPARSLIASTILFSAMVLHAQDADMWTAQGDSLLVAGKQKQAADAFTKALQLSPNHIKALEGRSQAWFETEKLDKFMLDAEKLLRLDTANHRGHLLRATYSLYGEDFSLSEHHATRAADHAPDDHSRARALLIRGQARAAFKRQGPAIEDLEAGLALIPDDTRAMSTLARMYDAASRHAEALALLEKLCEMEPDELGHWSNRGFELVMLGRYQEAMPVIEKALAKDKDEPVALSNRAYVHLMLGREKEAAQDVERSLRSMPANPYALRTRALIRLRKGDRAQACEDLTLAKVLGDIAEVDQLVREHCATTPLPESR
ncbi:MAG: tetratricopeptide repeat protein [Flavobacteriales bacterium]|nr:tetratricopeptide repeat protein [Flavobacteriales bacterium]